jgi:xanthine dehydrogenase D subunit
MTPTPRLRIARPRTRAEALEVAANAPHARFVAGGTALQLEWSRGMKPPDLLIALCGIDGLTGVSGSGDTLRIGALTPLGELERDARLGRAVPLLTAAILGVGAASIRNLATLGGNVAGRTGCLLPALLALDAMLVGVGPAGVWRRSLQDWLAGELRAGELIEAIELPVMPAGCRWTQRKIGLRAAFTPSVIGVAALIHLDQGRIALARLAVGGGIVAAARLVGAEASLIGRSWESLDWRALRVSLMDEICAGDDAFRSARYRRLAACHALVAGLGGPLGIPRPTTRRPVPAASPPPGEIRLARLAPPLRWHTRPDAAGKIAGTFAYLTDHRCAHMLVGRILRAGHAHARIVSIDVTRAEALPGVVAVVTHRDIPGLNAFGIVVQDQPALCHDKVRYLGDAVAAVAAVDAATAELALGLIDVVYEPLPLVGSAAQALAPGASLVHRDGNLQRLMEYARGDVDAGFAACAHIVDDVYSTPRQMHGFMETEGGWAAVGPDGTLAIHAGGQHAMRDRLQLARILAIPEERIRVVTSPTGGAFGGKDELTIQPALALLAVKSRRPVRLQLSRAESVIAGTKRHPMSIRMRTGCDAEGRILAQEVDLLADAGAYASLGPSVMETALEHAAGTYEVAHVKTRGRLVYTNNGVGGAFRGFGANQMNYAVECQMDRLAALCGLSPVEFRRRNLKPPGVGYFGQTLAPSERLAQMLTAAAASPLWGNAAAKDAAKEEAHEENKEEEIIGVGMALNHHGNGLGSLIPDPGGGRLRFARDGRIEACFTLDEMGQGLLTSILAIVSAQLGCGREDIRPVIGDTANGPDSGSTTAARGTFVVWQAMRAAGPVFSERLREKAGTVLGRSAGDLTLAVGGIAGPREEGILIGYVALAEALSGQDLPCVDSRFEYPTTGYSAANARFLFASGACVARVAVSRVTGQVRVLDLHQHSAAGPIMDVAAYLGQQEGGAVQGMGFTLSENALMHHGAYLTSNLDTYLMPCIADAPERLGVYALEELDPGDVYGPRGVGELGIGAVAPAIANAVFDAIGMCPSVSPISPESILDAMDAARCTGIRHDGAA